MSRTSRLAAAVVGAAAVCAVAVGAASASSSSLVASKSTTFAMVRSTGVVAAGCLPNAHASVTVRTNDQVGGQTEIMKITAGGLPANTEFDVFIIQVPDAPFGIAWYQGDLQTNSSGNGASTFVGRFSQETFAVAPGTAPAPTVHPGDANSNPAFAPVHMYHVGFWFGSPTAAAAAGCPNAQTPFNGDHTAGIQAMSTTQFPDLRGPLRTFKP